MTKDHVKLENSKKSIVQFFLNDPLVETRYIYLINILETK